MVNRIWLIPCPVLLLWSTERVWNIPILVCGAPAARPSTFYNLLDWFFATMGFLFLRELFLLRRRYVLLDKQAVFHHLGRTCGAHLR